MRSPREILFRLSQEAANLAHLVLRRPSVPGQPSPLAHLPAPAEVASAARAIEIQRLTRLILAHRFPLLGYTVATGPEIDWSRDYVHSRSAPRRYFRFIPYLDFAAAGDHKVIWELNRHQHWVVLAQAWLLSGEERFLEEIWGQFRSWSRANPYLRSINWASALEVAFRALSWTWVYHLAGHRMEPELRRAFLLGLYRHGLYLESNLSVYFSPNTHLLGEAVALHALGRLFPNFPRARRWERTGARLVRQQLGRQVREDGSHFEQSSYYHLYALDLFLLHVSLGGELPLEKLRRMAGYLADLCGPARRLPFLGDDDGGRLFHPYGARERFCRATLAKWGRPPACAFYPDAGIAILTDGMIHVVVDAGGFGPGSGGHSHSDTLSVVVRHGDEDILIDPGTYTYVADPQWRDWFRGSAAHNTVRVDGRDQAEPAGPFRWRGRPQVEVLHREPSAIDAVCRYGGVEHRRQVRLENRRLAIDDTVSASEGEHLFEQFWHAGAPVERAGERSFRIGRQATLRLAGPGEVEVTRGWRSAVPGAKTPAPVIRAWVKTSAPVRWAAVVEL